MTLISYTVDELSEDLKIQDTVIAYAEVQMGPMRNTRYGRRYERVRLGLQTSPENFFYNEGQWEGATYVNLNALEFTMTAGTAEAGAYDTAPVTDLFEVVGGTWDPTLNAGAGGMAETTGRLKLGVNADLIEQIEVREGDDYLGDGNPVQQIHLSLKSSNKPDFTLMQWHPQPKYRFTKQCNFIQDAEDETMAAAYLGTNNYVLSDALFAATLAQVLTLA
jgi:hypothetical protein